MIRCFWIAAFVFSGLALIEGRFAVGRAAASEERRVYDNWETVCSTSWPKARSCDVVQTVVSEKDASLKLTTVVSFHKGRQRFELRIATPLNLSLQEGIGLQVDDKQLGVLQYSKCGKRGCLAILEDADDIVREYIAGGNASYLISRSRESGAFIRVPLEGFESAILGAFSQSGDKAIAMAKHVHAAWRVVAFDKASRFGDCDLFVDGTPIQFEKTPFEKTRDVLTPSVQSLIGLTAIAESVKECDHGKVVITKMKTPTTSVLHKYMVIGARLKASQGEERERISAHLSALGVDPDRVVFKATSVPDGRPSQ